MADCLRRCGFLGSKITILGGSARPLMRCGALASNAVRRGRGISSRGSP
jgi:hypothetical protein